MHGGMSVMQRMIWSVISIDMPDGEDVEVCVTCSERSRQEAVDSCAEYIIDRLDLRPDIRYALMHDENHPNLAEEMERKTGESATYLRGQFCYDVNASWDVSDQVVDALRELLKSEIFVEGGYDMFTRTESDIGFSRFMFLVEENPLTEEEDA